LDIKNPFDFSKLEEGRRDWDLDNIYSYDKVNFLEYLKDNSEDGGKIVLERDDFVAYLKENTSGEYDDLIEAYENGEIDWYEEYNGASLRRLYDGKENSRYIITPFNLEFAGIHRGMLQEYSQQISDYAKENGFDGIVASGVGSIEIVVFDPNQIKEINNLYPTKSDNFKDNSKEYLKENMGKMSIEEQKEVSRYIKEHTSKTKDRAIQKEKDEI
jgi:hypothetical protein